MKSWTERSPTLEKNKTSTPAPPEVHTVFEGGRLTVTILTEPSAPFGPSTGTAVSRSHFDTGWRAKRLPVSASSHTHSPLLVHPFLRLPDCRSVCPPPCLIRLSHS
ncbi:hypothetical protein ECG_03577 [Echinococcus granulosus]|uniref:Uncharacterized protein n=1 Tax=Echinococcus granulosus TaxID=6210 RepID=A0A068X0M6_ECHGR|nr:hypothetical protein ECG_03577 [Echinococcus granulosus]CDS23464.1 hypothetical protein EgrG_002041700 [Echinococcus granulosus]